MSKTLEETKAVVRTKYLGRAGIHGVGIRRATNALCLYVHQESPEQKALVDRIREEAAPYGVVTVDEEPPVAG